MSNMQSALDPTFSLTSEREKHDSETLSRSVNVVDDDRSYVMRGF